jgi:hypothetical protein
MVELPAVLFVLNLIQFVCVDLAYGYWGAAVLALPIAGACVWRMRAVVAGRGWQWRSLLDG